MLQTVNKIVAAVIIHPAFQIGWIAVNIISYCFSAFHISYISYISFQSFKTPTEHWHGHWKNIRSLSGSYWIIILFQIFANLDTSTKTHISFWKDLKGPSKLSQKENTRWNRTRRLFVATTTSGTSWLIMLPLGTGGSLLAGLGSCATNPLRPIWPNYNISPT